MLAVQRVRALHGGRGGDAPRWPRAGVGRGLTGLEGGRWGFVMRPSDMRVWGGRTRDFFHGDGFAFAVIVDEDELGEDLAVDGQASPFSLRTRVLRQGNFLKLFVGFIFVAEAAPEAAAAARDFGGIEGGWTLAGPHGDGGEDFLVFAAVLAAFS